VLITYGLLSLIPVFLAWVATYYVIEHIEDGFWKLECKLNNEMELEERLEQLREQRLRVETEITKLTELHGSRESAIDTFYLKRTSNSSRKILDHKVSKKKS
jgi:CRISPR/Cas system CMR subunit Cmr4 (Cas7 group RAMP superfamily)